MTKHYKLHLTSGAEVTVSTSQNIVYILNEKDNDFVYAAQNKLYFRPSEVIAFREIENEVTV